MDIDELRKQYGCFTIINSDNITDYDLSNRNTSAIILVGITPNTIYYHGKYSGLSTYRYTTYHDIACFMSDSFILIALDKDRTVIGLNRNIVTALLDISCTTIS